MKYLWTGMALKYGKYVNADLQYQMKLFKQLGRSFSLQSPLTKHNWYCAFGFLINTAPLNVYFILHYCSFFRFIFEFLYFSEYDIRMFLFIFWLRGRPPIKYSRNWGNEGGSSRMKYLFMFLSYGVLFYL